MFLILSPHIPAVRILFFLVFLLSPVLVYSGANPPPPEPDGARYNLLLVVVNSLNKFHLPLYGYSKPVTPNLDRFARDAYVFKNLITPVSHTPPVIRELFKAAPYGRQFFVETDWSESDIVKMSDYPIGRSLAEKGYVYFHERLPDDSGRPFVSFMHIWNLHFPYDLFRRRRDELPPVQRKIYERRLKGIDDITLVKEPVDTEEFSAFMDYQIFGVRRTQLPVGDGALWGSLLNDLKQTDGSPAAMVAAGLPARLTRRLARIKDPGELTRSDKAAIVRALNSFVNAPDSPVGKILFGPKTVYSLEGLTIGDAKFNRWDQSFVTNIEKHLYWKQPGPLLRLGSAGQLELVMPLDGRRRALLRQLYREALELILPALALHHPQHLWIALSPAESLKWQKSPSYQDELALFKNLYDANLSDVDGRFNECLEYLSRIGALDKTVLVFMGDHGEALMEHGKMEHGNSCYDEDISPPFIVRVPGRLTKTVFVETQLRTADVLPTLVELMGHRPPLPSTMPSGISLASALDGGRQPDITAFSRSYAASRSIRRNDGWKLHWDMDTRRRELYNWKKDPGETRNLAGEFPRVAAELEEQLNGFLYGD